MFGKSVPLDRVGVIMGEEPASEAAAVEADEFEAAGALPSNRRADGRTGSCKKKSENDSQSLSVKIVRGFSREKAGGLLSNNSLL